MWSIEKRVSALLALVLCASPALAQERVRFASLAGTPASEVDGYVFRPPEAGRHPAIVFLHGCGGLLNRRGEIERRERDWAARFTAAGSVVLMVDSFTSRGVRGMCAPKDFHAEVYRARPGDAYGALLYLQAQDFVRADAIGLMGWSEGGGAVLFTVRDTDGLRPQLLPKGDFRAAVAFYPATCDPARYSEPWTTRIPLLVLTGALDVWTPAAPCEALIASAERQGAPVAIHVFADAYHDFDWPDLPQHELPAFRTKAGVVPIEGTNVAARNEVLRIVPEFISQNQPK